VRINLKDGSHQDFDNNGNSYPMTDGIIFQKPQSCLLQGTGALTATALVRNDLKELPVRLGVSYLTPRNTANGNPVPALNSADVAMTQGECVGQYTFFSGSFAIPGGLSYNARVSVLVGEDEQVMTDEFNHAGSLGEVVCRSRVVLRAVVPGMIPARLSHPLHRPLLLGFRPLRRQPPPPHPASPSPPRRPESPP
jgi:hypothetical protein